MSALTRKQYDQLWLEDTLHIVFIIHTGLVNAPVISSQSVDQLFSSVTSILYQYYAPLNIYSMLSDGTAFIFSQSASRVGPTREADATHAEAAESVPSVPTS